MSETDPIRVDDVLGALPELPELRPLLRSLVAISLADPAQKWAGSGQLGTVGQRVFPEEGALRSAVEAAMKAEEKRLDALFHHVAAAVVSLTRRDAKTAAAALLEAAEEEAAVGGNERSQALALAAHRIALRQSGRRADGARALRIAARAARGAGRLQEAGELYEAAFRDAQDGARERDAVVAAVGRGNVAVDRGRWEEAEGWYRLALDQLDVDGDPAVERWHVCQNLSIVARERKRFEESARWLSEAERIGRKLGDPRVEVDVNNGWGQLLLARGELRRAELRFRRALAAAKDPTARATVSVNLGECLLAQRRTLEAAEVARVAEEEVLVSGIIPKLPEVYRFLGQVALSKESDDAFVFFERALDLIEELSLPAFERALTLEAYAQFRESTGEREEATGLLEEAVGIYEELGIDWRREGAMHRIEGLREEAE